MKKSMLAVVLSVGMLSGCVATQTPNPEWKEVGYDRQARSVTMEFNGNESFGHDLKYPLTGLKTSVTLRCESWGYSQVAIAEETRECLFELEQGCRELVVRQVWQCMR